MRVLALDTTTRAGSVALVEDETVRIERDGDPSRPHAERLPAEILDLLRDAHLTPADVDVFAIASGPGSFTGLRIGIATIQGLAFVNRRRVVAVSALEALAHLGSAALSEGTLVAAWMDAYRRDVFSALYRVGPAPMFAIDRLATVDAPAVDDPAATVQRWTNDFQVVPDVFVGDGAVAFASAIAGRGRVMPPPALAGAIGRIAVERARAGQLLDPAGIQPLYVRRPDAEIERDRRAAKSVEHARREVDR